MAIGVALEQRNLLSNDGESVKETEVKSAIK